MSGGFDNSDHIHPHHHYFLYNNHHRHHDYRFSPPIVMFRPGPALLLVASDSPTPRSQFLAHYSFTSIKVDGDGDGDGDGEYLQKKYHHAIMII